VGHDSQGVSQVATNSGIALPAASLQVHTHTCTAAHKALSECTADKTRLASQLMLNQSAPGNTESC
jgi:hypothetical protein